ncbi:hypothetical protein PR048_023027 [Dryococelus australis]|uniref:ATP-dependent DNA helicase n=1 Tax=Dryococelus australis TaxID=614101 RepID=A0ABQ9GSX4_9NEOP|nr:hypothetical protein PR048_023027 [Dryococelus australis]
MAGRRLCPKRLQRVIGMPTDECSGAQYWQIHGNHGNPRDVCQLAGCWTVPFLGDFHWLWSRSIVSPRNDTDNEINNLIIQRVPGQVKTYKSIDTVTNVDDVVHFPQDFLNSLNPSGLPPHELSLKVARRGLPRGPLGHSTVAAGGEEGGDVGEGSRACLRAGRSRQSRGGARGEWLALLVAFVVSFAEVVGKRGGCGSRGGNASVVGRRRTGPRVRADGLSLRAGETGYPRENSQTNGIVRHDSHMRKSGVTRPAIETGSPWWVANRSATAAPRALDVPNLIQLCYCRRESATSRANLHELQIAKVNGIGAKRGESLHIGRHNLVLPYTIMWTGTYCTSATCLTSFEVALEVIRGSLPAMRQTGNNMSHLSSKCCYDACIITGDEACTRMMRTRSHEWRGLIPLNNEFLSAGKSETGEHGATLNARPVENGRPLRKPADQRHCTGIEPGSPGWQGIRRPGLLRLWVNPETVEVCQSLGVSPDLNPIEHLWDELDRQVKARQARPKSIAQLVEWLQEEWRRIPVDVLQTLVESMPDRLAAVIAPRGGPTRFKRVNRVRFPAGSLSDFRMSESCRTVCWWGFFSGFSRFPRPFIQALLRTNLNSSSLASLELDNKSHPNISTPPRLSEAYHSIYATGESGSLADLHGNEEYTRVAKLEVKNKLVTVTTASEQTADARIYRGLWFLVYMSKNTRNLLYSTCSLHVVVGDNYLQISHASTERGEREIPEKTRRPAASSGTIPTCEYPGVTRPAIEPGPHRWEVRRLTSQPPRPRTP